MGSYIILLHKAEISIYNKINYLIVINGQTLNLHLIERKKNINKIYHEIAWFNQWHMTVCLHN
jgi:hypothetical protein